MVSVSCVAILAVGVILYGKYFKIYLGTSAKHGVGDMKENPPVDATALLEEAETSENQEAYRTLERHMNCRIGVGVRLTPPKSPSFFVEVIIYLCPSFEIADLDVLEKSLACLKKLKVKQYTAICQDSNCISCEAAVTGRNLAKEYREIQALMKASFS